MMHVRTFTIDNFTDFMFSFKDLSDSLEDWGKNTSNTWDMVITIGKGEYTIYIELDENKDKSE
tara:strand:+ start:412 stop:600 length:189 start_codon:yes stop_codon:yes gene_type:complete